MPLPDIDGEQWLRNQMKITPEEAYRRTEEARKEGRAVGLVLGFLLGAIGLPIACNMLPDHLRQELQKTMESDGSQ